MHSLLSPAPRDQKFEDITELLQVMTNTLRQIPGYEYSLISFGIDKKLGTVGHCSQRQIIMIMDTLLAELDPGDAIKYLLKRIELLKEALIEAIRERGKNED